MALVLLMKLEDIPPSISEDAERLNQEVKVLRQRAADIQNACDHEFTAIKFRDGKYKPRLDGVNTGQYDVIKEFHCPKCNLHKPLGGDPYTVCRLCGGTMKYDRREQFGMDRAHVHKCEKCGHEYDTL